MTGEASTPRQPALPVEGVTESLSPTARKILTAAKKILATEGLDALTLDAIARAARVNKAATHYHFGSKAGLIEAIVDEIVLDECVSMSDAVAPDASLEQRLDSLMNGVRRMAVDPSSIGGWWDILPHALRTEALHARLVQLYEVWFGWNLELAGLGHVADQVRNENLRGLGELIAAAVDGIALQAAIAGPEYDPEPTLRTLRYCLETVLAPEADPKGGALGHASDGAAVSRRTPSDREVAHP